MAYVGTGAASAWVNFDGTGTPSIRDDHNCSSIGDVGTGLYLMNIFSGVLPDDDICDQITADNWEGTNAD